MGAGVSFAKALVLAWTRLYTAGLPDEMRARRCAEIESDVWELEHDPDRPRFAAAHLLLRLLRGIWHDLRWRIEQRTPYVATQLMLHGVPRHPAIVTSAFTCSLTVHFVAGAVVIWLAAFPFHRLSVIALQRAESASVPAPTLSAFENDATDAAALAPARPDPFLARLLQNRYALSVHKGQLSLAGAYVLSSAIAQSRLVVLGEDPDTTETPEFWAAVSNTPAPPTTEWRKVAAMNGHRGRNALDSLHIRIMAVTLSPSESGYLQPIYDSLLPSDWTMFDLRPLRQELRAPGSMVHRDLSRLILGYDILVMVPVGEASVRRAPRTAGRSGSR